MAPKQSKGTKNPPMVTSSEEEEEESGSFSEESREESDSSCEEDGQEKPIQTHVFVPFATKPVQESHVSVLESSTDDEATKKKLKRSRTHKQVKKTDDESKKKKMKRSRSHKHLKKLNTDEKKMKRLRTDATDEENSVDDDEARKKTKRRRKEAVEVTKMSEEETIKQQTLENTETNVASSPLASGREMVSVLKDENLTSFGLDESSLLARWRNMVADGPKKRAIEEKLKRLTAMKVELCLTRTDIVADATNVIFKEDNASSSDRKHTDPKECQDIDMEEKEVDFVSDDANIETENEYFVTMAAIENKYSCVASGGIKEGTASVSRKKLLVLDINGLLASIVSPLPDDKADINIGGKAVFKRPFCQDFLKFCFKNFEVGIWSSRKQKNVKRITEFLLGDMKSKLMFCWDMSYCATTSVKSLENRHKSVVFKDLNKLWEKQDQNLPWQKGDYNETNTVLLDDSPYKALLNPPYTAIFPYSYDHQNKTDTSLGNGGDLRLYLEKLVEAENVQDFIKKNPFGQEAITESSDTWEFYSQAIRNLG